MWATPFDFFLESALERLDSTSLLQADYGAVKGEMYASSSSAQPKIEKGDAAFTCGVFVKWMFRIHLHKALTALFCSYAGSTALFA